MAPDRRSGEYTGRSKVPFALKCSPKFWFENNFQQTLDEAPWYEPDKPQAERERDWNLRNPAQNLRAVVLGCLDKNYKFKGKYPADTIQRNDLKNPDGSEQTGFQWTLSYGGDLWVPRWFISYSGKRVVWYYGTNYTGFYGAKFNLHKANTGYNVEGQ